MARVAGGSKQQSNEKILKAAIYCLTSQGDKATTFQTIAARAGVSPALVVGFFGNRDEIYPRALDYVIQVARVETQKQVTSSEKPIEQLKAYFRVSIEFFRTQDEHAKIYLMLYHFATYNQKYRKLATEIKEVALRRIEGVLIAGQQNGDFPAMQNIEFSARFIHNSLNGLLMSLLTNEQKNSDSVLLQQFETVILKSLITP